MDSVYVAATMVLLIGATLVTVGWILTAPVGIYIVAIVFMAFGWGILLGAWLKD